MSNIITAVSGLPRSGTSLMMQILEAAEIPILNDGIRTADNDNPEGYYEFERVKQLNKGDHEWLAEAGGKAIKIISALIPHLPSQYTYRILFVQRNLKEVLASQRKMLIQRGEATDEVSDADLELMFTRHLKQVQDWISRQPNISVLYVNYNQLVDNPEPWISQIMEFLQLEADGKEMVNVVKPTLYRNRQ